MILFNGATGGLGRHFGPHLQSRGLRHRSLSTRIERADHLGSELASDTRSLQGERVTLVHLAAMVSVAACEADPKLAQAVNVDGAADYVRSFIDWADGAGAEPLVVYVSTGHVYAPPSGERPLTEDAPLDPRSVYAATKLAGESAVAAAAAGSGVPLVIARVFGLLAPGQPSHYLLPALIDRVRKGDVARIPGLCYVRDYLDSRDVVAHLGDLAQLPSRDGTRTIVNVCSGVGVTVWDVLDAVIDEMCSNDRDSAAALRAKVSEAPGRPSDVPWLVGSPRRLVAITARSPQTIPLPTTVRDAVAAA